AIRRSVSHSLKHVEETLIVKRWVVRGRKGSSLRRQVLSRCQPSQTAFGQQNAQILVKSLGLALIPAFVTPMYAFTIGGMKWGASVSLDPFRFEFAPHLFRADDSGDRTYSALGSIEAFVTVNQKHNCA